jgi:hypothetical protein
MQRIDRRADYIAVSRPATLDRINDLQAASDEGRRDLERAYQAHVQDDWPRYLHFTGKLDALLRGLRDMGDVWAGEVTAAPALDPNQLEVWSGQQAA